VRQSGHVKRVGNDDPLRTRWFFQQVRNITGEIVPHDWIESSAACHVRHHHRIDAPAAMLGLKGATQPSRWGASSTLQLATGRMR